MPEAQATEKSTPPYIPWKTLENFVDKMRQSALPGVIDNSLLHQMAGSLRSQFRSSLRFLGLTGSDDVVTKRFRDLVDAFGTENWKPTLSGILMDAYAPVVGDLNIKTGTASQLHERFKPFAGEGVARERSVRFYLAAMKEAGIPTSPHFNTGAKPAARRVERKAPKDADAAAAQPEDLPEADTGSHDDAEVHVPGVTHFQMPIPGKKPVKVSLPDNLAKEEWDAVIVMLQSYVALLLKKPKS